MKPVLAKFLFAAGAALAAGFGPCGCGKAPPADPARSSVTPADLEASPLAHLAKAIEDGDARTVAASVLFPLKRESPIPPVRNEEEFVAYFPVLFDEAFRESMRSGRFADDWEEVGWRGTMYRLGQLWVDGTLAGGGEICSVNYQSAAERRLRESLVEEERRMLPSWLADTCDPVFCFRTDDGAFAGRVDREKGETFRIALFRGPARNRGRLLSRTGEEPETVFRATAIYEGSAGNHTYLDLRGCYALDVTLAGPDGAPELALLERRSWSDAFEGEHPARYCLWRDLLDGQDSQGEK